MCVCMYISSYILFHYGLSQHTEYSSLCCTVGTCFSSLYVPFANPEGFHFPSGTNGKESTYQCRRFKRLGLGRHPGGCMATHSSMLAWNKPWTEEPGSLQSMGLVRGGYNWSDLATLNFQSILPLLPPSPALATTRLLSVCKSVSTT